MNPRALPVLVRLRVVEEVLQKQAPVGDVARIFGIAPTTVKEWCRRYEEGGPEALVPAPLFAPKPAERPPDPRREAVSELRREHPEYGTRRIADVLRRFAALGISESEVRRILHEEGLMEPRAPTPEREQPARRFERAA